MRNLIPSNRNRNTAVQSPASRYAWDFDRMLNRFFEDPFGAGSELLGYSDGGLRVDVSQTEDEVILSAEVPGVDPKDLDISITGDVLTLAGEKKHDESIKEENRRWTERMYGSFRRDIQLPCQVDAEKVRAEHRHGVVTIHLPKAEGVRPRRIQVKSA